MPPEVTVNYRARLAIIYLEPDAHIQDVQQYAAEILCPMLRTEPMEFPVQYRLRHTKDEHGVRVIADPDTDQLGVLETCLGVERPQKRSTF